MIETMKYFQLFFQLPREMINSVSNEFECPSQIYARYCPANYIIEHAERHVRDVFRRSRATWSEEDTKAILAFFSGECLLARV